MYSLVLLTLFGVQLEPIEDGQTSYLTVFAPENHYLKDWFRTEPLLTIRKKVHYNEITFDQALYTERFAPQIAKVPTVLLQDYNGVVLLKLSGSNLPLTATQLAKRINNCPLRPRPEPTPAPMPKSVEVEISVDTVPDTPPDSGFPLWVAALLGLGGAAVGGYSKLKEAT